MATRTTSIRTLALTGFAMAALAGCSAPAGAAGEDRTLDAVERNRTALGVKQSPDASYEQVERARAARVAPHDDSVDQIERNRAVFAPPTDASYDDVERLRAGFDEE